MPELRKDPVVGRWVIISTERSRRPTSFVPVSHEKTAHFCPFCAGNEDRTPPEVYAVRPGGGPANGPGWRVPDPAYHFETARPTVRRLNGWFRGIRVLRSEWERKHSRTTE